MKEGSRAGGKGARRKGGGYRAKEGTGMDASVAEGNWGKACRGI